MNISELFSKNNLRIFKLLCKQPLHIRDVADHLAISPAAVTLFTQKYADFIIEKKVKNTKLVLINKDHSLVKLMRALLNFQDISTTKSYKKLKRFGQVGVYGSFAIGTNDENSDLDLWIKTDTSELELRPIIRQLEEELSMRVSILLLSKPRIKELEDFDKEFFLRLKITSVGDQL